MFEKQDIFYDEKEIMLSSHQHSLHKARRPSNLGILVVVILVIGTLLTLLNIYQLQQMRQEHAQHFTDPQQISIVEGVVGKDTRKSPVVWMQGKRMESGYLKHVKYVFERLGFAFSSDQWDVLWAHDYPFISMAKTMSELKPHQKVNHWPGSGFVTNKGSLASSTSNALPRAFRIPKDKEKFKEHIKQYPEKLWVQKNNNHRGIRIKKMAELDFASEGSFLQEFVMKPLLIDKRKFDIGVYTIITSLDPLRIYIVNDESLFRFCPKDYYPFNADDTGTYVVSDNYTPMWEMPSLKDMYVNKRYGFKESFNRYMTTQGKNVTKIWENIKETIRSIYLEKQSIMLSSVKKYKSQRNFFEMVRFDFVLDENCKLFLMEVNMSPNLSTGHFSGNRRLYEHVVYNMLRVVGIGSMAEDHFRISDKDTEEMLVSDKEVSVFSDWCMSRLCDGDCESVKCKLCSRCLTAPTRVLIKDAYLEHINRGGCQRVFPPTLSRSEALHWTPDSDKYGLAKYKDKTMLMYVWFIGMCRKDVTWCR